MLSNILIATDFSDSSIAAMHAGLSLAKKCLGRVHLVHIVSYLEDLYNFSRFGVPDWDWQTGLQKRLDDFFPSESYPNSEKHLIVGHSPTQEILKYARTAACELIVVGYHGHTALSNFLMGSVTHQITRFAEMPVLVVKAAGNVHQRYQGFERVLVPSDFSDCSQKALAFGLKFANFLKADLHLVHVIDAPALKAYQETYTTGPLEVDKAGEMNVNTVLQKMLAGKATIGDKKIATLTGDPAFEIVKYAQEQKIDFIVMGTHGRRGIDRILMGSATAGVLAKSEVPVITLSYNI